MPTRLLKLFGVAVLAAVPFATPIGFQCPCQSLDVAELDEPTRQLCAKACAASDPTVGTLP